MQVVEFLKRYGIKKLKKDYAISVKETNSLLILNYTIASPKFHDITKECRGLILDEKFNIVSRSFDRFFNYGEIQETVNFESCSIYEKIDGSLIKIYYWNGKWNVSTRNNSFADNLLVSNYTFKDLVFLALGGINEHDFQQFCHKYMDIQNTYIFEVTAEENRIVTKYEGYILWFLATRKNTGEYETFPLYDATTNPKLENIKNRIRFPRVFQFDSIEKCISAAKNFKNFEEGFVVYNSAGAPISKIKNPEYVAMHQNVNKNKNGLPTREQIIEMYLNNEADEYTKYFPETKDYFTIIIERIEKYLNECKDIYEEILDGIKSAKEFAEKVNPYPWKWIAFIAKNRNENFINVFHNGCGNERKMQFLINNLPKQMILFVGISGSGKSTEASRYESLDYVNINRDEWRFKLFEIKYWSDYIFNKNNEKIVTEKCLEQWNEAKCLTKDVVISDCNLKKQYREYWKKLAEDSGYEFSVKFFKVSLEDAIKNDLRRNKSVGKDVILNQWSQYLKATNKKTYIPDLEKPPVLLCDIDGTIALTNGKRNIYDYGKVLGDVPRIKIIDMIRSWTECKNLKVIFISGRDSWCRKDTETWILRYFPEEEENLILHMRKTGDIRKDYIVKEEIFWNEIANRWNVIAVIDDRPQVIQLWHDIELDVINVQKGSKIY